MALKRTAIRETIYLQVMASPLRITERITTNARSGNRRSLAAWSVHFSGEKKRVLIIKDDLKITAAEG